MLTSFNSLLISIGSTPVGHGWFSLTFFDIFCCTELQIRSLKTNREHPSGKFRSPLVQGLYLQCNGPTMTNTIAYISKFDLHSTLVNSNVFYEIMTREILCSWNISNKVKTILGISESQQTSTDTILTQKPKHANLAWQQQLWFEWLSW